MAALLEQPLAPVQGYEQAPVDGPSEWYAPGDSVPSARLVGGVIYQVSTSDQSSVHSDIVLFEDPRDAQAEIEQEIVLSEAGGEPYGERTIDGTTVYCWSDGLACTATVGRAYLRVAGGTPEFDILAVAPTMRASRATLALARAEAAGG